MWRTFISYYCEECREDISRRLWALGGNCPSCGVEIRAHQEQAS